MLSQFFRADFDVFEDLTQQGPCEIPAGMIGTVVARPCASSGYLDLLESYEAGEILGRALVFLEAQG